MYFVEKLCEELSVMRNCCMKTSIKLYRKRETKREQNHTSPCTILWHLHKYSVFAYAGVCVQIYILMFWNIGKIYLSGSPTNILIDVSSVGLSV